MKIAILGWGSLVWERRDLPKLKGEWFKGGPLLPLEFSRISESRIGILTLVIDPQNGKEASVRFATSARITLEDAICDLRTREGTVVKYIGFVDLVGGSQRCNAFPKAADTIRSWASNKGFEAVVWTDLPSNFCKKHGQKFEIENAVKYLKELCEQDKCAAKAAHEYINNAPEEINTPLRIYLQGNSGLKW